MIGYPARGQFRLVGGSALAIRIAALIVVCTADAGSVRDLARIYRALSTERYRYDGALDVLFQKARVSSLTWARIVVRE